jgi:hypothetical protein
MRKQADHDGPAPALGKKALNQVFGGQGPLGPPPPCLLLFQSFLSSLIMNILIFGKDTAILV